MSIFNNTERAFRDKTDQQLRKAYWMFKIIQSPSLTNIGTSLLNFTVKNNFPFVKGIVKNTIFEQFCGGETRDESMKVVEKLYARNVGSILDYALEGKAEDKVFDEVCEEIKKNALFSIGKPSIPFVVFKPTAFGRVEIYELVNDNKELTEEQQQEWNRVKRRYDEVCSLCHEKDIIVMIDAEEFCMQDAVDRLVEEMMEKYNKQKAIVWNTLQMYRTDRIEYMNKDIQRAREKGYYLGYKFVRGAYMDQERERAEKLGYPSPIQPTKQATDDNYDATIPIALDNIDIVSSFFGTHNELTMEKLISEMKKRGLENNHPQIYSGQLYGMSDHITYCLSETGYNVAKYVPYSPIKDLVPYLIRRAEENTSIAGQTTRELNLIEQEIERRSKTKK